MQLSRRPRPVLYGALAFIMLALLAALFLTSDYFYNAAFALRPLCIARDLGWCDYVCTRWGGHNSSNSIRQLFRARRHRLLSRVGASTSQASTLPFAPPRCRRVVL